MCFIDTSIRAETRQERRSRLVCEINVGQAKVNRHVERLRTENPRLHAALQPLLADLDDWMTSVAGAVAGLGNDAWNQEARNAT